MLQESMFTVLHVVISLQKGLSVLSLCWEITQCTYLFSLFKPLQKLSLFSVMISLDLNLTNVIYIVSISLISPWQWQMAPLVCLCTPEHKCVNWNLVTVVKRVYILYCVTDYHKFSSLNQHQFIIPNFFSLHSWITLEPVIEGSLISPHICSGDSVVCQVYIIVLFMFIIGIPLIFHH